MIDTKELRRRTEWGYKVASDIVIELLDRLEAVESECLEEARLNGMGASREAALMAKLEAAEKEIASWKGLAKQFGNEADDLRAKIEQMERDLRLIAETDPVDAALDPQRAVRIAHAALEELK